MHNLGDDKELDRLSREAAGRYMPPGQPNWDALSAGLDKEMPVEEKKRRIPLFWWILPVLLAGGATAYWLTQGKPAETPSAISAKKENVAAPVEKTGEAKTKSNTVTIPADDKTGAGALENVEAVIPSENTPVQKAATIAVNKKNNAKGVSQGTTAAALTNGASGNPAEPGVLKTTGIASNNGNLPGGQSKMQTAAQAVKDKAAQKEAVANPQATTENTVANPSAAATNNTSQTKTVEDVKQNTGESISTEINKENTNPASPSNTPAATPANRKFMQRGKGFSFGALAGVDESTVKFKYGNEVGYNLGVSIGYHFSNTFSLHTGAVYTQKNYKLAGEDFTAPKGSWVSYYKLNNVEGYCRMWEIPLLARYTIRQGNRSSVFLSTGLSSYFMTREDYDYQYFNNAGVLVTRNMGYNSTDTHVMSIMHLSAGFESRMSKNLSLIIEPYAKLPLGGVGFGNIRLSSFGLNFGVQFRQPSKK